MILIHALAYPQLHSTYRKQQTWERKRLVSQLNWIWIILQWQVEEDILRKHRAWKIDFFVKQQVVRMNLNRENSTRDPSCCGSSATGRWDWKTYLVMNSTAERSCCTEAMKERNIKQWWYSISTDSTYKRHSLMGMVSQDWSDGIQIGNAKNTTTCHSLFWMKLMA